MLEGATRRYTKKVILKGEGSSNEARTARLRQVRNMANLSREKMCEGEGLNMNTYKGWEIARYGGLPVDGAQNVMKRVAKENVICTLEWLLHGEGIGPYIIPTSGSMDEVGVIDTADAEDLKASVFDELMIFKRHFSHALTTQVKDDGLAPWYRPGDFVAGIKHYGKDILSYLGECCIVETSEGEILVRCIKQGESPDRYNLFCANLDAEVENPVIYDVVVVSAAPIIRHYRA